MSRIFNPISGNSRVNIIRLSVAFALLSGCMTDPMPVKPDSTVTLPVCSADNTDNFCVEAGKDKAARLNKQGLEFAAKQEYDQALSRFKEAIELDNTNPEYYYNLGLTYYHLEKPEQEEAAYMKVLEIEPDDPGLNPALANTYFSLACLYAQQGKKDHAFDKLEKLFTIAPATLYNNLNDRDLDSLRDDPRYKQLLSKKPANISESRNVTPGVPVNLNK